MKEKLFLLVAFFLSIRLATAQNISVKSVNLRMTDMKARTNQRVDASGKACAIIRVGVVGVKDLKFPDAIGDVDYRLGEYIVYVPDGLKELKYHNTSGSISNTVKFDDYGLDIETKRVYSLIFETENHIRAAIFSVQPESAELVFDGKEVSLDENGMVIIEKPIGKYNYHVQAKGYEDQYGNIELTEDEVFTTTTVNLLQKMYPLIINSTPSDASLFIDNVPYGKLNEIAGLKVPEGVHSIRLTAVGYDDYEQSVNVAGQAAQITASLHLLKKRTIKYNDERTRTSVNIRNSMYITLGGDIFDKDKYEGFLWGLKMDFSFVQHFGVLFSVREGFNFGLMRRSKDWMTEHYGGQVDNSEEVINSTLYGFGEIPLQLGISIPFGKFNKYQFNIWGGVYGRLRTENDYDKIVYGKTSKIYGDYGLRATVQFDLNRLVLGGDYGYSLNGYGNIYSFSIGLKIPL